MSVRQMLEFMEKQSRLEKQANLKRIMDLLKGIGIYLGLEVITVPGATGYLDTNYEGKAQYALKGLEHLDFVFIHIEAPDEAGHNGDTQGKIQAVEDVDRHIVGRILDGLKRYPSHHVMVLPDHYTPISVRTHTSEPVPFCIYSSDGRQQDEGHVAHFDEETAGKSGCSFSNGEQLMAFFLKKDG